MKRRIVVFGWIWTFALNALWVPGGLDYGYLRSVFFPAWYLFLIGLVVAAAHEGLVTRLPRLWISAATSIALTELCLLLFNGKTAGLFLAVPTPAHRALIGLLTSVDFRNDLSLYDYR